GRVYRGSFQRREAAAAPAAGGSERQGYFGRSWNNVVPSGPFRPMTYPQAYEHPELAASN
ncbi:MAG: hypothetical protein AAF387_06945, partial [Pseudomonadota bacterium]